MDLKLIRAALATAVSDTPAVLGKNLTVTSYTPTSVNVPHFFPMDAELHYHDPRNTFNRQPAIDVNCLLLTAEEANDDGGQQMLDAYLSHPEAATSVKGQIEQDQTLGGLCKSVFVHDIDGYRLYTVGLQAYYGARFRIQILGG